MVTGTVLGPASPARAAFDVVPLGCAIRFDPFPENACSVFGYDNPNDETLEIPLGADNLVLESPNTRPGQTIVFEPGRHEAAWLASFNPTDPRRIQVTWYLQGATVLTNAERWCAGAVPEAPSSVGLISPRPAGEALQVGDTLQVTLPPQTEGALSRVALERCLGDACLPLEWDWLARAELPSHTVGPEDVGYQLRLRLVELTGSGWASVVSTPTAPVAGDAAPPPPPTTVTTGPPVPVTQPVVTGQPVVGQPIVADAGEWSGAPPLTVAGSWQRCTAGPPPATCATIPGASGAAYRPTTADVGSTLRWVSQASTTGVVGSVPRLPVTSVAASAPSAAVEPAGDVPPGDPPPATDPRPRITALRLAPRVFRVGARPTALGRRAHPRRRAPRGTTVVLGLTERAFVRLDLEGRGRTVTLTRWLGEGTSRLTLTGRFGRAAGGPLEPGNYRLRVQARDRSGDVSRVARRAFRVVR